jgi:hypothetical protein
MIKGKSHISFSEMTWPRCGGELADLEWRLRYSYTETTKQDRLMAASVLAAYAALVAKPQRARNKIVKNLRKAEGWK